MSLHMLLKSEMIWIRIGQVIWSWNDINISETACMIKTILFHVTTTSAHFGLTNTGFKQKNWYNFSYTLTRWWKLPQCLFYYFEHYRCCTLSRTSPIHCTSFCEIFYCLVSNLVNGPIFTFLLKGIILGMCHMDFKHAKF